MAANKPFVSKEMKGLSQQIKKLAGEQKALRKQLREHAQKVIDSKFDDKLLDALEELEKKEVEMETQHIALRRSWLDATQKERRERLQESQSKLSKSGGLASSRSIFSNSVAPRQLDELSTRVFGKSSRAALKGPNPFLEEQQQAAGAELDHDISTWELRSEEIAFGTNKLGEGSFGSVTEGKLRGKSVAIKTITPKYDADEINSILDDFRNECAVMSKLLHPNVLLLMGVCIDRKAQSDQLKLIMVTELMARGSVFDLLHKDAKRKIVFKQRMKFAKDACLGMNWLHLSNPPILHLDLKTANLLVDQNWVAKVSDFGLSRVKKADKNKGATGSPVYMAPEVLADKAYDEKADVFSFAVVLWELVTNKKPYEEEQFESLDEIYDHVVIDGARPKLPAECPPQLSELIKKCWDTDPAKRPTFQSIIDSHLLDEVIVDAIISNTNQDARAFWKKCFTEKDEILEAVKWKTFIRELVTFCKIEFPQGSVIDDQIEVKSLKLVLANKEDVVTIENFSRALEWFGPFTLDRQFMDNVQDTISISGFFGDISSQEAEQIMAGKKAGQYMVRFSTQQPGFYTITAMSEENALKHYRIKHKAGLGFLLGNAEYPSLPKLIKANRKELYLKRAVKGSKYSQLFVAHEEKNESAYIEMMV